MSCFVDNMMPKFSSKDMKTADRLTFKHWTPKVCTHSLCGYFMCVVLFLTSYAKLGLGVDQGLLDLLRLSDVYLQKRKAWRTDSAQVFGSLPFQIQYCCKHFKPHGIQPLRCGVTKSRITTYRREKERWKHGMLCSILLLPSLVKCNLISIDPSL